MAAATMTRSAHGLTTSRNDWHHRARCRDSDPTWFDTTSGTLSNTNMLALRICRVCPVRPECRDDMRDAKPSSIIAGGWVWYADGRPTPHRGEEHLAAVEAPLRPPGFSGRHSPEATARWLAAGRALRDGEPANQIADRLGLTRKRVWAAGGVARTAPDVFAEVEAGTLTITQAERLTRILRKAAS